MVNGFTEIEKDVNLYISHLCFHKKGCWYDYTYFQCQGFDKPITVRRMIILDLSDCDIINSIQQDPDTIPDDADQHIIPHLTIEKWVIVLAVESPLAEQHQLTDAYF